MSSDKIKLVISAVDKASAKLRNINKNISGLTAPARAAQKSFRSLSREAGLYHIGKRATQAKRAMANVGREAGALAMKLGALGGVAAFAVKRGFIDTAAQFERFNTILQTVEGSSEKAQAAMDWVSDFATKTPFELNQVMEAFVRLRAYGMDPTDGLLRTLGDTGSAMGKTVMQAVEAIADAVTGENERLKEFGIKAAVVGNQIRYAYTDKAGKQQFKIVDKNNRAMIQSTLEAIWNEKYAGAMEKQSKTWVGMISNIKDQWTRFANLVMENGVFDWMKSKLKLVLDQVNKLAESGKLRELATEIGGKTVAALRQLWQFGKEAWDVFKAVGGQLQWLHDLFGSWKPIIAAAAAVVAGPLLMAIGTATTAIWSLGAALLATPLGWFAAGVAAIAGGAYLIIKNWEPIKEWWSGLWSSMSFVFDDWFSGITDKINTIKSWVSRIPGAGKILGLSRPGIQHPASGIQQANVGGTIHLKIDSEGRPSVKELTTSNPAVNLNVDSGLVMVGG